MKRLLYVLRYTIVGVIQLPRGKQQLHNTIDCLISLKLSVHFDYANL